MGENSKFGYKGKSQSGYIAGWVGVKDFIDLELENYYLFIVFLIMGGGWMQVEGWLIGLKILI